MKAETQIRTYKRSESAVFSKTKEGFGGLSNMAAGFPVRVNGIRILTSEALYQACRFPHRPEVQRIIIGEPSPMTAKMKSKPYRKDSRPDWDQVRVKIMRWCLRVKLVQNWRQFSDLLLATGDKPIVEESRKDEFWGAKPVDDHTLVGMNVLGRLLMELREEFKSSQRDALLRVEPLPIPDFLLNGLPIETIVASSMESKLLSAAGGTQTPPGAPRTEQASLFDQPSLFDEGVQELEQPEYKLDTPAHDIQADGEVLEKRAMVADLKPYTEYKESGLPWLGRVPGHWAVLPHRALFEEVNEREHPNEQMLSVTITRGVIKQRDLLAGSSKKDSSKQDKSAYKLVCPGDIAYNKMRAWQGAIGMSDLRGIISPAYVVQRMRGAHSPRYFHHLFRTPGFAKEAESWSYGITSDMWSLRPEHFKAIYSALPPAEEQVAIVRFLDHANRRLERTIRAKRKVIALLNEQKQAIIHRAVTRGLDPTVPLKPSGISWLGDIPQHWEALPVKRCSIVISKGTTPSTEGREILEEGPIRFIKAENISGGVIVDKPRAFIGQETHNVLRRSQLHEHDILFVIAGATLGKIAIVRESHLPANTNQAVAFIRPNHRVTPEFLAIWLKSNRIKEQIWLNAVQSAQPNLSMGSLGDFPVPLPPVAEQAIVVERVDAELRLPNAAIAHAEREISLLREYRTRLIADVVTGKLDVREAARHLPEETEEPEASPEPVADDTTDGDLDAAPEEAEA